MTFKEKKENLAFIKAITHKDSSTMWAVEELEKAWQALEFYSTCNDCLYEGEDELIYADNGKRARLALGTDNSEGDTEALNG